MASGYHIDCTTLGRLWSSASHSHSCWWCWQLRVLSRILLWKFLSTKESLLPWGQPTAHPVTGPCRCNGLAPHPYGTGCGFCCDCITIQCLPCPVFLPAPLTDVHPKSTSQQTAYLWISISESSWELDVGHIPSSAYLRNNLLKKRSKYVVIFSSLHFMSFWTWQNKED